MTRFRLSTLLSGLLLLGLAFMGILYCGQDGGQDHAFAAIDKALLEGQKQINIFNVEWENDIRMEAEAYRNPKNDRYAAYATQLLQRATAYCLFIDSIKLLLPEANQHSSVNGKQSQGDWRLYDAPGKILVSGEPERVSLANQIARETRILCNFIDSLADGDPLVRAAIPLQFDYFGNGRFQIDRHQSSFLQLPLTGILAVLSDLQNRAAVSASVWLNYCWDMVHVFSTGGGWVQLMASAKASYILPGDRYEADIFLNSFGEEILSEEISIDGKPMPIKEGMVHYEVTTQSPGRKTFQVESVVRKFRRTQSGLVTDTIRSVRDFSYFVSNDPGKILQPASTQYLYVGVENPVTLTARYGLTPHVVHMDAGGAEVWKSGPGQYRIKPGQPGKVKLKIRFGGETVPSVYEYTALPLPDPLPCLGDSLRGGRVTPEMLNRQTSLQVNYPEDFDFQVDCAVISFQLTRIRPRDDSEEAANEGGIFNPEVRRLLETARPDDRLLFHDIAVRVPGDQEVRMIGAMVFRVE
jgi:hypothetical protein